MPELTSKRQGIIDIVVVEKEAWIITSTESIDLKDMIRQLKGCEIKVVNLTKQKLQTKVLITYSLENLDQVKKTQFGYALRGRTGSKGILDQVKGKGVGRNNIFIPHKNYNQIKEFFRYWNVKYTYKLMMEIE